ncbi:L-seryl-tRNA(Sec) selenium transferase [Euzebya rosea]|uniref:L-seryl-tRNA(Sec) selenium transferase n=1 Tax=Euzebya rosea TaxID=2052804 RepID=UPI000D3ED6F4|nr:L-seryl-tRNA(Sec) selenium transferase [Euzebya rosea]
MAHASANPYADLPRMDDLLTAAAALIERHGRTPVVERLRAEMDRSRAGIAEGRPADDAATILGRAADALDTAPRPGPRRVVNAAGVVVHTNLGRAPLSPTAVAAMVDVAGYCDLEYDLDTGRRGSRGAHVDGLLAELTGAADAMVVNNCAAALVLVLAALASGREVVVSRGHLVEIGGSFRLPDVMASSGARLLEVGTTNRTRAEDYREGDDVAALLTVHPSNFTQDGFVTQPRLAEVADVARDRGIPLVHDAGSGLLAPVDHPAMADEPSMRAAIDDGADLVLASGDKLLGGPQAGLIVGRADLVQRCRRHPLARALRLDKLRLAALVATLDAHRRGAGGTVDALLAVDHAELGARVDALRDRVGGTVVEGTTMVGGGSAPGVGVTSPVLRVALDHPLRIAEAMRHADPPVIVRVADGAVVVDLRTVTPADDALVTDALRAALQGAPVPGPDAGHRE